MRRVCPNVIAKQVCSMMKLLVYLILIQKTSQRANENKSQCNGRSGDCCAGFRHDRERNICVECPIGYFGNSCEKICPYPLFGHACRNICHCLENECNIVDGCVQRKTTENNFLRTNVTAERTRPLISVGNLGNTTFHKLNSSFIQNDTEHSNDNQLSILSTKELIEAPIRISIIILVCVSAIILVLYLASYRNFVDRLRRFIM